MNDQIKGMQLSGGGNLKAVPGGPNIAQINATNEMVKNADAGKNYAVVEGGNQQSNEFPYIPYARDNYDDIANIKQIFSTAAAQGGAGATKTVVLDKEDANYVLRQRAQIENADFDRWVMSKYDLTDPAQNFLMQQIAPDQFQRRLDLIEYQQGLVSKYARLRLLGAKSLEDLKFEWLVETGRVEMPQGPIWDPVTWMNNQLGGGVNMNSVANRDARSIRNRARFQKGLFSPLQPLNETEVGWDPNYSNPSDVRGEQGNLMPYQAFSGSTAHSVYGRYGKNPFSTVDGVAADYAPATVGNRFGALNAVRFPEILANAGQRFTDVAGNVQTIGATPGVAAADRAARNYYRGNRFAGPPE